MKVVIIGPRGSGKSTVASALRFSLGFPVTSIDKVIEEDAGCSIPEIVEKEGWDGFRLMEANAIKNLDDADNTIVDVGGGAVMYHDNAKVLTEGESCVIYLTASLDELQKRVSDNGDRPSLTGNSNAADEMEKILAERTPTYEKLANHTFRTDEMSAEEIADKITEIVESA